MILTVSLDSAVHMVFITFLAFQLQAKGGGMADIGMALMVLCGYMGARFGMMETAWLMAVLPLLGLALNGTSSVLYGAVPYRSGEGKRAHAF